MKGFHKVAIVWFNGANLSETSGQDLDEGWKPFGVLRGHGDLVGIVCRKWINLEEKGASA